MSQHEHTHDPGRQGGNSTTWRMILVLIGFIVIAGALLFTEHRAHVLGALIFFATAALSADAFVHARRPRTWRP